MFVPATAVTAPTLERRKSALGESGVRVLLLELLESGSGVLLEMLDVLLTGSGLM